MSHSNSEPPVWAANLFALSGFELIPARHGGWWPAKHGRRFEIAYDFNSGQWFYENQIKIWEDPDVWSRHSVPI